MTVLAVFLKIRQKSVRSIPFVDSQFYQGVAEFAYLMVTHYDATEFMLLKHITNKDAQIIFLNAAGELARVNHIARLTELPFPPGDVVAVGAVSYYETLFDSAEAMEPGIFLETVGDLGFGCAVDDGGGPRFRLES